MDPHAKLLDKLRQHPELVYSEAPDHVRVEPPAPSGFALELRSADKEWTVYLGNAGFHETFTGPEEVLDFIAWCYSGAARIREVWRGRWPQKAILEAREDREWHEVSETGFIFVPFWCERREVILENPNRLRGWGLTGRGELRLRRTLKNGIQCLLTPFSDHERRSTMTEPKDVSDRRWRFNLVAATEQIANTRELVDLYDTELIEGFLDCVSSEYVPHGSGAMTAAECAAARELGQGLDRICEKARRLKRDKTGGKAVSGVEPEDLIALGWFHQVQPLARTAFDLFMARG